MIQGAQTAIVVGKPGEEIDTDEYGRIKVQFHWDRHGKKDDNSSCRLRVAQAWAGQNWGAIHVPRIGQEVIVSFLEGDPDRPIVTGSVYNGANKPPYTLPANATQSGLKTRSSKRSLPGAPRPGCATCSHRCCWTCWNPAGHTRGPRSTRRLT